MAAGGHVVDATRRMAEINGPVSQIRRSSRARTTASRRLVTSSLR